MEIRKAKETDIPEIISVLRASLGESKLKKTEKIWRYKHLNNPFGNSLVLLAIAGNEIAGVRAFMRWKWQLGSTVYSSFRAVDTATHPKHQGKGVFKKLTLKAIEIAKEDGDHFIFNTPNSQSKPGYLKMGWEEVDKLAIQIKLNNPLNWDLKNKIFEYQINKTTPHAELEKLTEVYNLNNIQKGSLFTPKSVEYLQWRFENNPLQQYEVVATKNYYVAAYIKEHNSFKELRLAELIYTGASGTEEIKDEIRGLSKKFGAQIVTSHKTGKLGGFFKISGKLGPVLTLKNLTLGEERYKEQLEIKNWFYTLGDLELF